MPQRSPLLFSMLLMACSSSRPPAPPPAPSSSPAASASASPSPPPIEAKPEPPKRTAIVFRVSYVNLGAREMNHQFDIDEEGGTLFAHPEHVDEGVRGHVSRASLDQLAHVTKKLCAMKEPNEEPLTFELIETPECRLKMTDKQWKARMPELMKLVPRLQEEACRGPCRVPDHFMED